MALRYIVFIFAILLFSGIAFLLIADLLNTIKKSDKHNKNNKRNIQNKTAQKRSRFI